MPIHGIVSQIGVSVGNYTHHVPNSAALGTKLIRQLQMKSPGSAPLWVTLRSPPYGAGEAEAIAIGQTSLSNQAPYTPTATAVQHVSWQANDPLVHYLASDLNWPGAMVMNDGTVASLTNNNPNGTLGQLNQRYMPWGGNPLLAECKIRIPTIWPSKTRWCGSRMIGISRPINSDLWLAGPRPSRHALADGLSQGARHYPGDPNQRRCQPIISAPILG